MMTKKILITIFLLTLTSLGANEGLASWYGGRFQGRLTANGEIFDTYKLTAAHKTLPFGTIVKVHNLNNGKSTIVRINDRGPFVEGRIIDLSKKAAIALDMMESGVAPVQLEILEKGKEDTIKSIQVGAYKDLKNAQDLLQELRNEGLPVTIVNADRGVFRVVIANVHQNKLPLYESSLKRLGYDYLIKSKP